MKDKLYGLLEAEYNKTFEGWDFSYLSQWGRMKEFPLTWNYRNVIQAYIDNSHSLLDMGTGGGEFLAGIEGLPSQTCATEGYEPNVLVAQKRLEPLGIEVKEIFDDSSIPFCSSRFDLIINRHESYNGAEVNRVMKSSGVFITQQVGGKNDMELNQLLEAKESEFSSWGLAAGKEILKDYFNILKTKEDITKTRFYDVESIVYYLKAIPWQIPDFSVKKYYTQLEEINNQIEVNGFLDVTCHRFLIVAKKAE